jgi:hypothetical protein
VRLILAGASARCGGKASRVAPNGDISRGANPYLRGAAEGAIFMVSFGLGTLPLLLAVSVLGRSFSFSIRQKIKIAQPILLTLVGLILLQRGLHLDLSLFESAVPKAGCECH